MSMHDQAVRTADRPALSGKLGEIDDLLQAAKSRGALSGERAVLEEISRIIARSSGDEIYQNRSADASLGRMARKMSGPETTISVPRMVPAAR